MAAEAALSFPRKLKREAVPLLFFGTVVSTKAYFLVKVLFNNSKCDLDAALVDPSGQVIAESRGVTDQEVIRYNPVDLVGRYVLGVYGFGSAVNTYDLDINISE